MISGYCIGMKPYYGEGSVLKETKKIFIRLIVPYLVWSMVYMFIGGSVKSAERYIAVFTLRGIAPLWFLAALALCEFIFFIIAKATLALNKNRRLIVLGAIAVICLITGYALRFLNPYFEDNDSNTEIIINYLFITFARFFISMPTFIFGYILSNTSVIYKISKKLGAVVGIALIGIVVAAVSICRLSVNTHLFSISNYWIFTVVSLCGSVGTILISYSIEDFAAALSFLGKNSLGLMILHYVPFKTLKYTGDLAAFIWNNQIFVSFLSLALTVLITIGAITLIKKKFFIFK